MTVKEYLSRPKELAEEIRCDMDNLAAMRSVVENCTTHMSFTAGRNPSKNKDAFEDMMIAITMEEERIAEKIKRLSVLQLDVLKRISGLKDPDRQAVLRMRFIDGKSWTEIAKTIVVSKRHAMRIQQEALEELENSSPFVC